MSLQVWLPLIDSLENKGVSDLKFSIKQTNYRYIQFVIHAVRGGGADSYTQLSRLEFVDKSGNIYQYPLGTTVATNMTGYAATESPINIIDGNVNTKFCVPYISDGYFTIDLGISNSIDLSQYSSFQWYTANDGDWRDPVSFSMWFSVDGSSFEKAVTVTDAQITKDRYALAYKGACYTSTFSAGKIGANCCSNYSINMGGIISNQRLHIGDNLSMFTWVKLKQFNTDANLTGIGGMHTISRDDYDIRTGMGITIHSSGKVSFNTGDGAGNYTYNSHQGNTELSLNTWYHIGFTCKKTSSTNSHVIIYINGKNDGEFDITNQNNPDDYVHIASWARDGNIGSPFIFPHYQPIGDLQDFRIYDHTLSALEVKELSKGLAIHYTFDDELAASTINFDPCKNASIDKALTDISGHGTTVTFGNYFGHDCFKIEINSNPTGGWRGTYMVCAPVAKGASVNDIVTRSYWMYVPTSEKDKRSWPCGPHLEGSYKDGKIIGYDFNKCDTWQRVSATAKITGADVNFLAYFMSANDDNGNINFTCYVRDFQLEIGDHPTPFTISNRASMLCNETGFTQPSSVNNISISSVNNRIGKYSGQFNGMNSCIDTPMIKSDMFTSDYTLNFWAYPLDSGRSIYFGDYNTTGGGFVNIERFADGNFRYWYNGGEDNKDKIVFGLNAEVNKWTMLTVSHSTGVLKFYKNGSYIESYTLLEPIAKTSGIMRIGRDGRDATDATIPDNTPFYGYMDDFRFYVTQLSDEEILDLYNCGASLSDLGDAHANQFNEGSNFAGVDEKHIINAHEIYEDILGKDYQQLEYIESNTSGQYIDTGFVPNADTSIELSFKYNGQEIGPTVDGLFGARVNSTNSVFGMWIASDYVYPHYGSKSYRENGEFAINTTDTQHTYRYNKNIAYVDNTSISCATAFFSNTQYSLYLFNMNDGGKVDDRPAPGQLYGCKIYDDGTLVRNYLPAQRLSDNAIGLYDTVNEVFNQGVGSFIAGPTVTVNETSAFTENENFTSRQIIEI